MVETDIFYPVLENTTTLDPLKKNNTQRVLIFIDWYRPAYKAGGPIRSMERLVKNLSGDFDFFIFTGNKDLGEKKELEDIVSDEWVTIRKGVQVFYSKSAFLTGSRFRNVISGVAPHLIYINGLFSLNYSILPLLYSRNLSKKINVIVAPRGMMGRGALEFKKRKKAVFLKAAKFFLYSNRIVWHATDKEEVTAIRQQVSNQKIRVAPNFYPVQESISPASKEKGTLRLFTVCRIVPIKNLQFLVQLFDQIDSEATLSLKIIGPIEDAGYHKELEKSFNKIGNLTYQFTGPKEYDEINKIVGQDHIFILPTLHENFGHAILEALAMNKPVMISDRTPLKNLAEKNLGWEMPLEQPELWRQQLQRLIEYDENNYNQACENVSVNYSHYFKNDNIKLDYLDLFENRDENS